MRISCDGCRVFLQSLGAEDSAAYVNLANDPAVAKLAGGRFKHPYSAQDYATFISYAMQKQSDGLELHLGVRLLSGELIGAIALMHIDSINRKAELGFWTGARYQHKGYTREALSLLLPFSFASMGLKRIYARTLQQNSRSASLLKSLRFSHEGLLRSDEFDGSKFLDAELLAVLDTDYRGEELMRIDVEA